MSNTYETRQVSRSQLGLVTNEDELNFELKANSCGVDITDFGDEILTLYGTVEDLDKLLNESVEEDLEIDDDVEDDALLIAALVEYIDDEYGDVADVEETTSNGYSGRVFINNEDGAEYLVCDDDEAYDDAKSYIEDYINDVGVLEAFGYDRVEDYLNESAFDDMMDEDIRWRVENMSDYELIEEMELHGIIDDTDMVPDEYDDDEERDEDEEPEMHYPDNLIHSWEKIEALIDAIRDGYSSGLEYFRDYWGSDEIKHYVEDDPDYYVDIDGLIEDELSYSDYGNWLASYDNYSGELEYEDKDGNTRRLNVYRLN